MKNLYADTLKYVGAANETGMVYKVIMVALGFEVKCEGWHLPYQHNQGDSQPTRSSARHVGGWDIWGTHVDHIPWKNHTITFQLHHQLQGSNFAEGKFCSSLDIQPKHNLEQSYLEAL